MNFSGTNLRRAFTLVEMLVTIGIIALLAALLLPALSRSQMRAKRILCENNLHQLGIGFHAFVHDHNGKFPMAVSVADGGSLEFTESGQMLKGNFYFSYKHFQTLAGLLDTPKILVCPADTCAPALNFAALLNTNVSYFIALNADYAAPMSILSGDGNLASATTLFRGAAGARLMWTRTQHQFKGNVLFADSHVEEWGGNQSALLASDGDFVLPTINPHGSSKSSATGVPVYPATAGGPGKNSSLPPNSPSRPAFFPSKNESSTAPAAKQAYQGETSKKIDPSKTFLPAGGVVPEPPVKTSPAGSGQATNVVLPAESESPALSSFDRRIANFLRMLIGWSYFLLLLLLLIFLAWKIWRWSQDAHHRDGK